MEDFFKEQDKFNNITVQEKDILNVHDFSRDNPNITLGNLPQYEDLQKKQVFVNIDNAKEFEEVKDGQEFADREFKKYEDKSLSLIRFRVKLFMAVYAIVTLLIGGFVIYNLVNTSLLGNEVKQKDIKISEIKNAIKKLNNANQQQENNIKVEIPKDLNLD